VFVSIRRSKSDRTLGISETEVTDAGLERLEKLPDLSRLFIRDTRVTLRGVQKLQEALPNCEIDY
jgi:internalin A